MRPPRSLVVWLVPALLLAAAVALVALQVRRPAALIRVGTPWAETGMLAIAMTAVVLSGGIDLSVGSIAALSGVVLGLALRSWGWPAPAAVAASLAVGAGCGAVNGALVVARLSPLVATLATMAAYAGAALVLSGGERATELAAAFGGWTRPADVPLAYWTCALVAAVGYVAIHRTTAGRMLFALGDNPRAARMAAIRTGRLEFALYAASGFVAALTGVVYALGRDAAIPDAHRGAELRAIACVVVGGTAVSGGRGGVGRTLFGLATVALLDVGLEFLGGRVGWITAEARLVVLGALLVAVAAWNEWWK